jgi:hypothetical protein
VVVEDEEDIRLEDIAAGAMEVQGLEPVIIRESAQRITKVSMNRNANLVSNTVTCLKVQTKNLESVGMIGKRNHPQMNPKRTNNNTPG